MRITRYLALIGKINATFPLLTSGIQLTDEEKDIVRNAIHEYQFYHGHERVEVPAESNDIREKYKSEQAGKREKLSLKTPR